ncbi:MAG: PD-(D/E)XK nuclease family protein [Treponema sp.]|nr:PD-(D/E)XK nuclease family protein [Treponema sp.]
MNIKELSPSEIAKALYQQLEEKALFVFSTDVVMNSWIDYLLLHPEESGIEALPFEYFTAWDKFKSQYLGAAKEGYSAVPSVLRKFFISDIITKNAHKPVEERFQSIINPQDQYAKNADNFADWLCKSLPSLHFWQKRLEENPDYGELDAEDKDYKKLYDEYKDFLENNKLFEPAWIDAKALSDSNRKIYIFYPELLEDFSDYKELLSQADNVTIFTLPSKLPSPKAYLYPDSRSELRKTILRIRELVTSGKADWSQIALSIPKLDIYRPYLKRELSLYGIPFVIRAGESLTKNCAGKIFHEISDCYTSSFSYDSLRALLLDDYLPWKDSIISTKFDLIAEGSRMRCLSSAEGGKDIWLSALNSKISYFEKAEKAGKAGKSDPESQLKRYTELKEFYQKLKYLVNNFFQPQEFGQAFIHIRNCWMEFKTAFLKEDKDFSEDANNILSRCIKELGNLIQIEESYKDCQLQINSPYDFYLQELDKKTYTKQNKAFGISIYPYKLSAAASIKYQFVIDASQDNLDIAYKRLSFLNTTKRSKLKLLEEDKSVPAADAFIKLYAKDADHIVFSSAEESFNGFAIPHSSLEIIDDSNTYDDFVLSERDLILKGKNNFKQYTSLQKASFANWESFCLKTDEKDDEKLSPKLLEAIKYHTMEKKAGRLPEELQGKAIISPRSDLERFFPCPRKWLLKAVLSLKDDTLDTSLMQNFDMGNLNHKIMELFMEQYKEAILPYYDKEKDSFMAALKGDCSQEIRENLISITEKAIKAPSDFRDSPLVIETLLSQKEAIADVIYSFLKTLLLPYGESYSAKGERNKINGIGNCSVAALEEVKSLGLKNFTYLGVIDCLIISPDEDYIIIDYKNSKSSIPAKKDLIPDEDSILKDFQMAVYYTLMGKDNIENIKAGYFYSISDRDKCCVTDEFTNDTLENFSDSISETINYAELFASTVIREDRQAFEPHTSKKRKDKLNVSKYKDCAACNFKTICRSSYRLAGKEIRSIDNE